MGGGLIRYSIIYFQFTQDTRYNLGRLKVGNHCKQALLLRIFKVELYSRKHKKVIYQKRVNFRTEYENWPRNEIRSY